MTKQPSEISLLFVLSEDPSTPASGISVRVRRYLEYAGRIGSTTVLYPARADRLGLAIPPSTLFKPECIGPHTMNLQRVGAARANGRLLLRLQMAMQHSFPDGAGLPIDQLAETVRKQICIRRPTVIWFDMPSTFPILRRIGDPDIPVIGCFQDSSSLLLRDSGKASKGINRFRKWLRLCLVQRAERDLDTAFSRLVFLTTKDAAASLKNPCSPKAAIIPLAASDSCFSLSISPAENPLLVFVGTSTYWPNADAVSWLCSDLFPALRRLRPDVRLRLAGRGPWPEILGDNVTVLSDFQNLGQALDGAWAAVAPVRFGAGMQNKVLESVAAGVPTVAHEHALRGAENLSVYVWQFKDTDGFVKRTLDCLNLTAIERTTRTTNARTVAMKSYSSMAEEEAFRNTIFGAIADD
jgi:glycosyltransferase involved in cell wall biosynthesis